MFRVQDTGEVKYVCGLDYRMFVHMLKNIMESDEAGQKSLLCHILAKCL